MFLDAVYWLLDVMRDFSGGFAKLSEIWQEVGWSGTAAITINIIMTIIILKLVDILV